MTTPHINIQVLANAYYGLGLYAGIPLDDKVKMAARQRTITVCLKWGYIDRDGDLTEAGLHYLTFVKRYRITKRKHNAKRGKKK